MTFVVRLPYARAEYSITWVKRIFVARLRSFVLVLVQDSLVQPGAVFFVIIGSGPVWRSFASFVVRRCYLFLSFPSGR